MQVFQNNHTYPWIPPSADYVKLNCSSLATLWNLYWSVYTDERSMKVYWTVVDGLEDYLRAKNLTQPPMKEVFNWVQYGSPLSYKVIDMFHRGECRKEMCSGLGWKGNPDITGQGMLATYVIQAALITMYIPVLVAVRSDKVPMRWLKTPTVARSISAVQHSTVSFLNASLVFAVAMLSASLVSFARHEDVTTSTMAIMIFMPFSSILPVALLQLSASDNLRRTRGRLLIWITILGLMIGILSIVAPKAPNLKVFPVPGDDASNKQTLWEVVCVGYPTAVRTLLLSFIFAGLVLLASVAYIIGSLVMSLPWFPTPCCLGISRSLWWTALVSGFVAMWGSLGWVFYLQIMKNGISGNDNEDMEWSFGQVLAIATWVPVMIEFAYVWWERPVTALTGGLMVPYEVIEGSKDKDTTAHEALSRRDMV